MYKTKGIYPFVPYVGDIVRLRDWGDFGCTWSAFEGCNCDPLKDELYSNHFHKYNAPILSRKEYEKLCLCTGVIIGLSRLKHEGMVTVMWDNGGGMCRKGLDGTMRKSDVPDFALKYVGGNE